jgi:hypothetical protein
MTMRRRWVGLSVKVTVDNGGCSPMMSLGVTDRGGKFRLSVGERRPRGEGIVEIIGTRESVGHVVASVGEERCNVTRMEN